MFKKTLKQLSKEVWQQGWTAEQPLLKQYAQIERLIKYRHIVGNVATENLIYGENGWVRGFFTEKSYKKIQIDGKKLLNQRIVNKYIKEIKSLLKDFWATAEKLKKLAHTEDNLFSNKFLKLFKEFNELVIKLFAYIFTTWEAPSYYPEMELKQELKSFYHSNWEQKFITLVTPSRPDLLLKEKIDWLNVLKNSIIKNIQKHMFRFSFLFANIDSEKEAINLMRKKINSESLSKIEQEIAETQNRLKGVKNAQNRIFKETRSQEIKNLSYLFQQFVLLRLELKVGWQGIHYYLFPLFKYLAKANKFSIRDVMMFWSLKDIINFLEKGIVPSKDEMQKRREFYLLVLNRGKMNFYIGKEARKIKREILDKSQIKELKEFKGSIANKGNVKGKVKLIKFDDLRLITKTAKSIKEKIILVTGMTNPNMMPLIRKAKGIITDEGGMTCHAAIISREFNIPCVVGTRIATQVLKDDDLVEVDANNGIVKNIKL